MRYTAEELIITARDTAVFADLLSPDEAAVVLAGGDDEPTFTIEGTREELLNLAAEIRRAVSAA